MTTEWDTRRLGDLCEVIAGQSPPGETYNAEGVGVPMYQGKKDFGDWFVGSPTAWTTKPTKLARAGDILMSVRAPVGPVNFATDEVCIGRGLAAIRANGKFDKTFLFYQLLHLQPAISGTEGAVFPSINKAEIEAIQIRYTALPEQKRIVGILDEAFAAIDKAKANTERNIENARALFDAHIESTFARHGDWPRTPLSELAEISTGPFGTMLHKADYVEGGVPLVNPINIMAGKIIPSSAKTVSAATAGRLKSYQLKRGDVVVARRGELGRCAVVGKTEENWLCGTGSFFVRFRNGFDPEFFAAFFGSRSVRDRLAGDSVGSTMESLNHGILNVLSVPAPTSDEQDSFIEIARSMRTQSDALEQRYRSKATTLESLKASLLSDAFTGKL